MPTLTVNGPNGKPVGFHVSSYMLDNPGHTGNSDTVVAMVIDLHGSTTTLAYVPSSGLDPDVAMKIAQTVWSGFRFVVSKHPAMRMLNALMGANNAVDLFEKLDEGPSRKEGYYKYDDIRFEIPIFTGKILENHITG